MAPAILSYFTFGFGGSSAPVEEKLTPRNIPTSWYSSREAYDLERRALFSRRWLLVTHKLRLNQPGEWVRFNLSGFAFIICRDRSGQINAFHNVCRHRAYPVVEGADSGVAKIFACRYHGWSYGLNGKLAKAPGYQELDGFDKDKNSLFPIHLHIDENGFIWVNFDSKPVPELAWEDSEAADQQAELEDINFEDYIFDHTWEQKGEFNWKLLADNYNKSYHASVTDADVPELSDSSVEITKTEEQASDDLATSSTYLFPSASTNVTPHLFFIQRFDPNSPTSTSMRYEVYRNKNSSDDDFQKLNQTHKRVLCANKIIHEAAQREIESNVNTDTSEDDETLYFQGTYREEVMGHHKREEKAKREIWPARQNLPISKGAGVSQEDIEFCEGLACGTENSKKIEW